MLLAMDLLWNRKAVAAVFAAAALGGAPALAQVRADAMPESVLRPANLTATKPAADSPAGTMRAPSAGPVPRSEILTPSTTLPLSYSTQFLGSTLQLDLPRYDSEGKYVRPKFYVGMQSESMRNWANAAGLGAEKCMLPMVRARTHMSGDGELSGTLYVYARCSLR